MAATYASTTGSWFSSPSTATAATATTATAATAQRPPPTTPVRIPTASASSSSSQQQLQQQHNSSSSRQRPKRTKQQSADATMLSKSLGTYPHPNFFRSHSTNVSKISHSGFLYKRSNHPVTSPTSVAVVANDNTTSNTNLPPPLFATSSTALFDPPLTSQEFNVSLAASGMESVEREMLAVGASHSFWQSQQDDTTNGLVLAQQQQQQQQAAATAWQEYTAWRFMCTILDLSPTMPMRNDDKDADNSQTTTTTTTPQSQIQQNDKGLFTTTTTTTTTQSNNNHHHHHHHPAVNPFLQQLSSRQSLRSSPIPVPLTLSSRTSNSGGDSGTMSSATPPPRRIHSQSEEGSASDWQQEEDIVATDGHVWRARYCVLEEGVLYFYRHRADAENPVAVAEREESSSSSEHVDHHNDLGANNGNGNNSNTNALSSSFRPNNVPSILAASPRVPKARTHIWEKRVPVSCVGAVRSAEAEYGAHALELSAVQEDDDDVLILKARNATEMSEWLFQFHRSIEVWVKNIMTTSLDASSTAGEMIVPASAAVWLSPRVGASATAAANGPFLSHGHGRSSLHRQRVEEEEQQQQGQAAMLDQRRQAHHGLPFMPTTAVARAGGHSSLLPLRPSTPPLPPQIPEAVFELQDFSPEPSPELSPEQTAPIPPEVQHPAPPKGKYVPPHLRKAAAPKKYIPPHLRKQQQSSESGSTSSNGNASATAATPKPRGLSLAERLALDESKPAAAAVALSLSPPSGFATAAAVAATTTSTSGGSPVPPSKPKAPVGPLKLGGCADPDHVKGSVMEDRYIPRKASKLYRTQARPFGLNKGHWEIGAVSECGARDSNEDAYLIVGDLRHAFDVAASSVDDAPAGSSSWDELDLQQTPGLFCVFDGHCGDHAARYAAEKFTQYLYQESFPSAAQTADNNGTATKSDRVEQLIRKALTKLDHDFCELCVQNGRTWESGATALVAALCDDDLIIANLGDARGVLCQTIKEGSLVHWEENGWTMLPEDETLVDESEYEDGGGTSSDDGGTTPAMRDQLFIVWKSVTETHSPSREDERERIEKANGWITTEKEIPVSQAHRLDLHDELARDILNRCLARADGGASTPSRLIQISRVCGELAVSRALGDRDFKALSDPTSEKSGLEATHDGSWQGSIFLPYPDNHSRFFQGDLVSNVPEVKSMRIGQPGVSDEFLLLACDGLWDVMDADDAIRVARKLLLDEDYSVKQAAARLAKLAVHLGSSDNVTVLIIRFVDRGL